MNAPVEVADEVSLKADRTQFEEARKEIPEDVRKQNDELALVLQMMTKSERDEDPSKIRDRFNKALRDRREKNDKNLRQRREEFTKSERKTRDEFMRNLQKSREEFAKRKRKPDERKDFFDKQDESRKEFFASQADKRKEFESQMTEERKTFEDYAREKQNDFNQEIRSYTSTYYERQKGQALKKRMDEKAKDQERKQRGSSDRDSQAAGASGGVPNDLEQFRGIPQTPSTPLGAGDEQ